MTMTAAQLARIHELLKDRPQCRLVTGVKGLVTCDGMAIEFGNGGVIHPLAFLEMIDAPDNETLDILKGHML